jgi:monofunctional biosynthetic peptidoglycan transglycosylase
VSNAWRRGPWRTVAFIVGGLVVVSLLVATLYAAKGYFDALHDAPSLAARADKLIAAHRGPTDLTPPKLDALLRVDDPNFWSHRGIDLATPGSGMTSITQSLAKRLAFSNFKPGFRKLRQTAYAIGLERRLSKRQILALALDTAEMGRGPRGWMQGLFAASTQVYGKPPAALDDRQWLRLVAVLVAPRRFDLFAADPALDERVARIERLLAGGCRPTGKRDVWLEGCR